MRRRQNILFQGQREGLVLSAVCNHLVYRVAGWGGLGTAYLDAVEERWNCVESQKGTVFWSSGPALCICWRMCQKHLWGVHKCPEDLGCLFWYCFGGTKSSPIVIRAGGHFGMQSDLFQLVLLKTPAQMLSPVLWVQKSDTQTNKVYLAWFGGWLERKRWIVFCLWRWFVSFWWRKLNYILTKTQG